MKYFYVLIIICLFGCEKKFYIVEGEVFTEVVWKKNKDFKVTNTLNKNGTLSSTSISKNGKCYEYILFSEFSNKLQFVVKQDIELKKKISNFDLLEFTYTNSNYGESVAYEVVVLNKLNISVYDSNSGLLKATGQADKKGLCGIWKFYDENSKLVFEGNAFELNFEVTSWLSKNGLKVEVVNKN